MEDFIKWFENEYNNLDEKYKHYISEKPTKEDFKFIFLSDYIFNIATYDDDMSLEFGKKIFEVMKSIKNKETFEYINDVENYRSYIIVCNLLDKFDLIDWGSSIRGSWFNGNNIVCDVGCWKSDGTVIYENPTISIEELLKWIEES